MYSSICNPNFLLQKPFAHGTESCIKISAFRCVYFSVTEKWTVWQLRVCCITNIMSVYKRVNSRFHDIIFKNSVGEFPILLHMSWNVMNPLGPLMSFTYTIFPVIQSVNMSTFPWYLMGLLFHNKVGTGTEGSWQFKSSHVFNTEFQKWEVIICNPLKARLFRFEKKHKYLSPKGATVFLGTWLHLSSACAWNSRPTHCS